MNLAFASQIMGDVDFYSESEGQRILRKSRENPAFPIGIVGCVGIVLYGAYKYRYRGSMSTSIFLIQLRVAAQGTVIGCLSLGMAATMVNKYLLHAEKKKD